LRVRVLPPELNRRAGDRLAGSRAPSSRGQGHHPLKVETRVRIPLGLPAESQLSGQKWHRTPPRSSIFSSTCPSFGCTGMDEMDAPDPRGRPPCRARFTWPTTTFPHRWPGVCRPYPGHRPCFRRLAVRPAAAAPERRRSGEGRDPCRHPPPTGRAEGARCTIGPSTDGPSALAADPHLPKRISRYEEGTGARLWIRSRIGA
jgi:hypothetical protein